MQLLDACKGKVILVVVRKGLSSGTQHLFLLLFLPADLVSISSSRKPKTFGFLIPD